MAYTVPEKALGNDLQSIKKMVDSIKNDREVQKAAMKFHEILWDERKEGREEGREEGRTLTLIELVCRKMCANKTVPEIADALGEDEERIRRIAVTAESFAPDYDPEKILYAMKSAEESE